MKLRQGAPPPIQAFGQDAFRRGIGREKSRGMELRLGTVRHTLGLRA